MNLVPGHLVATLLPESILGAHWFAVLSTFVAINTILYVAMSVFKVLPKPYLSDVVRPHGRRAETRSIYPNGHSAPDEGQPGRLRAVPRPPGRPLRACSTGVELRPTAPASR